MKILVISHMYPSSQNQAYGIFIHKQVRALQEQGLEVKVISPVPYAPWPLPALKKKWRSYAATPSQEIREGIEVYHPRYPEFPRSFLLQHSGYFMYLGIRSLVKRLAGEFRFDLIHAHVALPDGHAAFLLKKEHRVPVVITVHGQDFQSTIHRGEGPKARLTEVLNDADRIITVSSKLKGLVQDQPYASKIAVINNGIDLQDIGIAPGSKEAVYEPINQGLPSLLDAKDSKDAKAAKDTKEVKDAKAAKDTNKKGTFLEPGSKEIKLISVSNLKKTKGLDLNIQAVARLLRKYPNLTYYIVGEGEERPNLESLVDKLQLREHVVFLGRLDHPEALRQMASADIFSLPSWQEGFGVVYIEAMAQGIPVIGVKGEGIEDVIIAGENGLLVNPQDTEDLTQALDTLLSNPEYAEKLAQAGRETVSKGFTWEQNAIKTKALYQELLST
jgi:teichuronic acid biosynthesis glycosyltransferase TuaC